MIIKFLRLSNGEDILAKYVYVPKTKTKDAHYLLNNPLKIVYVPSSIKGHVSISLMQWVFTRITVKQDFVIYEKDILTTTEPEESLIEFYNETVEYFSKIKLNDDDFIDNSLDDEEFSSTKENKNIQLLKDLLTGNKSIDKKKLN